jgi:hypothetical protein
MGPAIAFAGLGFCAAGFVGFALSFLVGVVVADLAAVNCLPDGCGAVARSLAAVGGLVGGGVGALAGFRHGLPFLNAGSAKRSTS